VKSRQSGIAHGNDEATNGGNLKLGGESS
jgi:hypothetical protein